MSVDESVMNELNNMGKRARDAATKLSVATSEQKNNALNLMAEKIRTGQENILAANKIDMDNAKKASRTSAILDRLQLTSERIQAMAKGIGAISELPEPVGKILSEWDRPNGLHIQRVSVPLGVIGVIYEARPNVTADAAALCLKSGNAVILRGGSDSFHSAKAIMQCISNALEESELPNHTVQMLENKSHEAVGAMLQLDKFIDVIVPRGGPSLIKRISEESKIPLFKHLQGICHTYIHQDADPNMAHDVVMNAKMRRPGICGATETLLIDRNVINSHLPTIIDSLLQANCEIRGDKTIQSLNINIKPATDEDWDTEYLDKIISIKAVDDINQAIQHITEHSSQHTDAIITENPTAVEQFLNEIDSAIVMHNTSTQFADGGEFGMGAEIGISTGKLHARGPIGIEQLTTFKYKVRGTGQLRPVG